MAVEIRLPQWGMGMTEGTVVSWLTREGATVRAGERIAEIEAAKTTEELAAPADGTIARIVVDEGETVPVHELLAVLDPSEEAHADRATAASPPAPAPAPSQAPPSRPAGTGAGDGDAAPPRRRQVAPRVRALAEREGVDLDAVEGSGPGGRVTEADVRHAAAPSPPGEAPAAAEAPRAPPAARTIPLTGMRGTIAQRMRDSLAGTAQLTLTSSADVTDLLEWRAAHPSDRRPSVTDLLVKASAIALREHPHLNAHIDSEGIHVAAEVHVGIATAVPDGLLVPVVRDADTKSVARLADERRRLVERVRDGDATASELSGSTFTVTNLGGHDIDAFTPIINPPEVAILGVGRTQEVPRRAGGGVDWRRELTLSLTIDHRAVDGVPGAEFLRSVVRLLGDPPTLLDGDSEAG